MDEITNNPTIPFAQKAKYRQLLAQAGQSQGVGLTGLASPGALMDALPRVVRHAIPTVGGAWAVAKLLGAPRRLKRTGIGAALIYSVLRGFTEKGASAKVARVMEKFPSLIHHSKVIDPQDVRPAKDLVPRAFTMIADSHEDGGMNVPLREVAWSPGLRRWLSRKEEDVAARSTKAAALQK